MTRTTTRALPALALAGSLVLAACGGGGDTAGTGTSAQHGGGHSTGGDAAAEASAGDVAFLTGMTPHHAQAVEMSEIVLAADPPAEVAVLARRIQQAQAPEIEQMQEMLAEMGEQSGAADHGAGHGAGHAGMLSDADLAELRAATGSQAARIYLEGMIAHHEGAIEASEQQVAEGRYAPAVELARKIKQEQSAEITEMRALLGRL